MSDKLMQFLVILSTLAMIALNGLAATGVLGGKNTGEVSFKYYTPITPATFAFGIWSLIYIGMIAFSFFQALPSKRATFRSIRIAYMVSCVANALWLYVWALAYDTPALMVLCQLLITTLLVALGIINVRLQAPGTAGDYWLVKAPFGIYFGWVTAATILNFTIMLIALKPEWKETGHTADYIGAALMVVAGVLGVAVRFAIKNYFFPLAIAWAALAIAMGHGSQPAVMYAAVGACVVCLIAAGLFVIDMKGTPTSNP